MKLRIYGNSVRLRLTQSEVRSVQLGQAVEGRTNLFPDALVYRIESRRHCETTSASFVRGKLCVTLPRVVAEEWAGSDTVGIDAQLPASSGQPLRLLIEKDFHCLHGSAEAQEDYFPNPADPISKEPAGIR